MAMCTVRGPRAITPLSWKRSWRTGPSVEGCILKEVYRWSSVPYRERTRPCIVSEPSCHTAWRSPDVPDRCLSIGALGRCRRRWWSAVEGRATHLRRAAETERDRPGHMQWLAIWFLVEGGPSKLIVAIASRVGPCNADHKLGRCGSIGVIRGSTYLVPVSVHDFLPVTSSGGGF